VPSDAERIGHTVPWTGITTFPVLTTSGRSARILDRDLAACLYGFDHYSVGRNTKCSDGGPCAIKCCDLVCATCVRVCTCLTGHDGFVTVTTHEVRLERRRT
jgi:hypothetical protein